MVLWPHSSNGIKLLSDSNEEDVVIEEDDSASMLMSTWGGLAATRGLDFDDFLFADDLGMMRKICSAVFGTPS